MQPSVSGEMNAANMIAEPKSFLENTGILTPFKKISHSYAKREVTQ